jgi:protease I
MRALILVADGFDDLQLFQPLYRLQEEGIEVTLAGEGTNLLTGRHGYTVRPDMPIHEVDPDAYDVLIIPGGASPEKLRQREPAVDIARTFMEDDKIVGILGHGAQLLISAKALSGRSLACSPGIADDVRAAEGRAPEETVLVDCNLISARDHTDLAQFCRNLIQALESKV